MTMLLDAAAELTQMIVGKANRLLPERELGVALIGEHPEIKLEPCELQLKSPLRAPDLLQVFANVLSKSASNCTPKVFSTIETRLYWPIANTRSISCWVL
jgi:hypothetical protein